jgi:hypothetical protein
MNDDYCEPIMLNQYELELVIGYLSDAQDQKYDEPRDILIGRLKEHLLEQFGEE